MKQAVDDSDFPVGDIMGAVSIAPGGTDNSTGGPPAPLDGPGYPPVLVVQGSKDADVDWQGFQAFDRSAREAPLADPATPHGGAALVYAYGVGHHEYGGGAEDVCDPEPRGLALNATYIGSFIDAVVYDDLPAKRRFWAPPTIEVPSTLDAVWPSPPPVFGTNRQPHDPARGYERYVVDDFENGDVLDGARATVTLSGPFTETIEGGLDVAVHDTGGAVLRWTTSPDGTAPSATWSLDPDVRAELNRATAVVLRGTTPSQFVSVDGMCPMLVPEAPAEFQLTLVDQLGTPASVASTAYVEFAQPDEGPSTQCGTGLIRCDNRNYLQVGMRVPLADFCGTGLAVGDVEDLILTFAGEGALAIDSLEFVRSPLDPPVACSCFP